MNTKPNHLTLKEFAARSPLSESTIRRYVRTGKLPSVQAAKGHLILIPSDALDTLGQESLKTPNQEPSTPVAPKRRSTPRWSS